MEYLTPTITQYVQIRELWGAAGDRMRWKSGIPSGVRMGETSIVDTPDSEVPYTVAWFTYFRIDTRAYDKLDENPNDDNIYLEIKITTIHNKMWTSTESPADGFIDIGVLAWNPTRKPPASTTGYPLVYQDHEAARRQLYEWAGIDENNIICGVIADNKSKLGMVDPGGTWGSHPNGEDVPRGAIPFTMTFTPDSFNDDGTPKEQYMPFVWASRWHEASNDTAGLQVSRTVDIDLSIDPFIYIPWAVKGSNGYLSCNRLPDGLMVHQNNSWSKVVKNSILARVVNNKFPKSANGFRVKREKWSVSPITPDL